MMQPIRRGHSALCPYVLLALLLCAFSLNGWARERDGKVTLRVREVEDTIGMTGDTVKVVVKMLVTPGLHVNANPAANEYYLPLEVRLTDTTYAQALKPAYPMSQIFRLKDSEEDMWVYENQVEVTVPVVLRGLNTPGIYPLKGTVDFQACDDEVCFMPETIAFTANIRWITPVTADEKRAIAEQYLAKYAADHSLPKGYTFYYTIEGDLTLSPAFIASHPNVNFRLRSKEFERYGENMLLVTFTRFHFTDLGVAEFEFGAVAAPLSGHGALYRASRTGSFWTFEYLRDTWIS